MNVKTFVLYVILSQCFLLTACGGRFYDMLAHTGKTQAEMVKVTDTELQLPPAKHWEVVGLDLARDISEMMRNTEALAGKPVYLTAENSSSFADFFEALLVEELKNAGLVVKDEPLDALWMRWSMRCLGCEAKENHPAPPYGTYVGVEDLGEGTYRICTDSERLARALAFGQKVNQKELTHVYRMDHSCSEIMMGLELQDHAHKLINFYFIKHPDKEHSCCYDDTFPAGEKIASEKKEVPGLISFDELAATIFFKFDDYSITREYFMVLDRYADILRQHPQIIMVVEGHTDTMGPEDYNLYLSRKRAETVSDYLIGKGVSPDQLQTRAHSFFIPSASHLEQETDDRALRAKNRRVELYLIIN